LQIHPNFFQSHTQQTTDVSPLSNAVLYTGRLLDSKIFNVLGDAFYLNLLKTSHNLAPGKEANLDIITWPHSLASQPDRSPS